jgi:hypothetical protein
MIYISNNWIRKQKKCAISHVGIISALYIVNNVATIDGIFWSSHCYSLFRLCSLVYFWRLDGTTDHFWRGYCTEPQKIAPKNTACSIKSAQNPIETISSRVASYSLHFEKFQSFRVLALALWRIYLYLFSKCTSINSSINKVFWSIQFLLREFR